ncbi:OmpA family protein [Kaistella jeonii]|uniref:OmpA family protein n=1 Tax=Kaistella jeonii TaxID=266749 RepID=UPI00068FBCC5|nr:OmpA family protein [Kaistella jeonii]SFB68436.1 Outer membrane protein OmpA [Kaistella jeonii]VEI94638.1 Root adhesin [Kaistella jeonii]
MKIPITTLLLLLFTISNGQFINKLGKKAQKATERAIEKKIEQKATTTTNKGMDVILNNKTNTKSGSSGESKSNGKSSAQNSDFVSGTKILFEENFRNDAESDFPVQWFTNSSGKIKSFDGKKWLQLSDKGSFTPIKLTQLPENFTFEFDVTTTDNFNFYSTPLSIVFTEKKTKIDQIWNIVTKRKEAVIFSIHPSNSLKGTGRSEVITIQDKKQFIKNKVDVPNFSKTNNTVRVQIWRQKDRFRMYVDGEKFWDLPSAFGEANYNQVIFFIGTYKNSTDKWFISNIKLAEAGEDLRHQLLENGSFSTNEILFDTNKAVIKPSSFKILDELATVLMENEAVKVSITGHTDNVGKDSDNQKLSENRAKAVAEYFQTKYKIVSSRLETFGKGASEPLNENTSEKDKMQNRRVEFVVIK